MSVTTELLIAAAIIVSVALQFGDHQLTWQRLLLPLAIVAGFAIYYLKTIPTSGGDGLFTLAGLVTGIVLGSAAGALIRMRRDAGRLMVTAGVAYLALWIVVFGARLAFALIATNSPETFRQLFIWAYEHGISEAGWTAAFMLQAIAMVGVRTLTVVGRAMLSGRQPVVAEATA